MARFLYGRIGGMEMTLDEMKNFIKAQPETKNLDIKDTDIIMLYRYLTEDKQVEGGYVKVLKTEPHLHIVLAPTKEKTNEKIKDYLKSQLETFESDVYIQDASFDDFYTTTENKEKALHLAEKFVKNYPNDKQGLYLYGEYGTGKSYLMSAMAKELTRKNVNVLFVFMPDLVRSIRSNMNQGTLEKRVNQLKQCDCLILDDLGGEYISDWFRDEILFPILHYRLSAGLPVFITSNYDGHRLSIALSQTQAADAKIKAGRLLRRIVDLTTPISFEK